MDAHLAMGGHLRVSVVVHAGDLAVVPAIHSLEMPVTDTVGELTLRVANQLGIAPELLVLETFDAKPVERFYPSDTPSSLMYVPRASEIKLNIDFHLREEDSPDQVGRKQRARRTYFNLRIQRVLEVLSMPTISGEPQTRATVERALAEVALDGGNPYSATVLEIAGSSSLDFDWHSAPAAFIKSPRDLAKYLEGSLSRPVPFITRIPEAYWELLYERVQKYTATSAHSQDRESTLQLQESQPNSRGALEIAIANGVVLRIEKRHFDIENDGKIVLHSEAEGALRRFNFLSLGLPGSSGQPVVTRLADLPPRERLRLFGVAFYSLVLQGILFLWHGISELRRAGLSQAVLATILLGISETTRRAPRGIVWLLRIHSMAVFAGLGYRLLGGHIDMTAIVLDHAAPPMYRTATTPEDLVQHIPQEAYNYIEDTERVVAKMALKPSWFEVLVVFILSTEPTLCAEWKRRVLARRSMHLDAIKIAQQRVNPAQAPVENS